MEPAGNHPSTPKITLGNILGVEGKDTYNPPYDKVSFEKYLNEEHTSENIEFWNAAQSYKFHASRYYPPLIHRTFHNSFAQLKQALSKSLLTGSENRAPEGTNTAENQPSDTPPATSEGGLSGSGNAVSAAETQEGASKGAIDGVDGVAGDNGHKVNAGDEGEASEKTVGDSNELTDEVREKLKEGLGEIIKIYLTPGSEKEINVNDNVRKKAMARYEQGDYSPDVLRLAVDKAFEMMRVQSLGRYLAHCQKSGAIPTKVVLLPTQDTSITKQRRGEKKDKERCVLS